MNKPLLHRFAVFAGLATLLVSQAEAGSINDPVIAINSTSPLQQTLNVSVTINGAPTGTALYYTTDGTSPSTSSPTIASGSSLLFAQNATLQVEAIQNATTTSNIVTEKLAVAGMVSAGTAHTLILRNDGTVLASGDNSAGELGNGMTVNASTPVQVMVNSSTYLTGIVAVAAANDESFAVDNTGKVWAWGLNTNSQLGVGTSSNTLYATQVGSLSNIVGIAAAQYHTLALRADGTVWSWGSDSNGEAGNGAPNAWVTTPTQILAPSGQSGFLSGIVAVAAGASHSLALTNGGSAYTWGSNSAGQLSNGDNTLASQSHPVQVKQSGVALTNGVAIAAGTANSYFLKGDGTAWSAGDNTVGELGQGTTSATPVAANLSAGEVLGFDETLVAVSNQSALGSEGTLWTWGDNSTGKLGVGYTGDYASLPVGVNLSSGPYPSLASTGGNNQSLPSGSFTASPLTVTVTNNGTPVANTWVDFVVTQGGGLLASNTTNPQFSNILQVLTNSSGQALVYYQDPTSGAGNSQVLATDGTSQTQFSLTTSGGTGVPPFPRWGYLIVGLALFFGLSRLLPQMRSSRPVQ